jgi:hypothetical protein
MNKEFVSYEIALELKELGFDEPCFKYWVQTYNDTHVWMDVHDKALNDDDCKAPLYQQAFRFFRDKKLSDASINRHEEADGGYSYRWEIVHEYGVYEERHFKMGYKTYEEAELACLNKLIEIVKDKKD